jgi:ABC-type Zn uptake system ZnuABC Zn-binding protein ZnuA
VRFTGRLVFGLVAGVLAAGAVSAQEDGLRVVATTSIIADVAQNVAGDLLTVESLLPPDTDTHAYEPTVQDAQRVSEADLLLVNGAGYEAFIESLLENAGGDIPVTVVSNGIEIRALSGGHEHADEHDEGADPAATPHAEDMHHEEHDTREVLGILGEEFECGAHESEHEEGEEHAEEAHEGEGECDPHVWLNPQNVVIWTNSIADAFSTLDPANADTFRANADAYIAQLEALDAELEAQVETVPEESRILVTNHEFLGYFTGRYGFELVGTVLPGGTSMAETDPQALAALIELIGAVGVPAIFVEVNENPELADAIAADTGVRVISDLYAESLSAADGPAPTYLDLMRYNTGVIVRGLTGG